MMYEICDMYFIYIAWVVSLSPYIVGWKCGQPPHRDVGVTDHGLEASEVSFRSSKLRRFRRFRWFRLGPFWCFSGWLNFSNFGMLELNKKSVHAKKIGKSERPTKDILFLSVNLLGFCGEGSACPQISRGFTFRWSKHFLRGPSYSNSMMYSGYTWLCWKTMNSRGASLFGYAIRECLSSGIKPSKNDSSV